MNSGLKILFFLLALMLTTGAFAFQPVPKESAKALGVTRGKPFSAGAVFVDGKYIEPPYVVERWGTGIRINSIPVTGQVIDWNEFLKTQDGLKVEKKEPEPAQKEPVQKEPAQEEAKPAPAPGADVSALDDLFDDDPKPEKAVPAPKPVEAVPAPKPVAAAYVLSGAFKPNDTTRALVKRINASRTEIDKILRSGGFICFGSRYSRVSGDKRTLMAMLDVLPELMQRSESIDAFRSGVHSANLVYFNDMLCLELFKNRIDYRKLKERREKFKSDQKWKRLLGDSADSVL